ncbi:MAG: hypothetical protein LQ341_007262, partial [Variospora aurantia]
MASNLLSLLARVDSCITYFTQDFIPLVTTLTDHPALIADPQAEKLFTKRFRADTLAIKALIECFPDISSPVRSCLETERREVDELHRSVTADRAKLEAAQHTLNTDQQALRRREERLAADERNLTKERTELESRKVTHDTQEKSVLDRIGKLLAASEASNETIYAVKDKQLADKEDLLTSRDEDLSIKQRKHQEIVKANNDGVATFKRNRAQQIQEHQLREESLAANEASYEARLALLEE